MPVALGARTFDFLLCLVEHADRMVSKDELMLLVWPGLVVSENNLHVHVSVLRKLLGPSALLTLPGRGYRFRLAVTPVTGVAGQGASASVVAVCFQRATLRLPVSDQPPIISA